MEKINVVFHDEVNHLDDISMEFQVPFLRDPVVERVYLAELGRFILEGLEKNLRNRLGRDIAFLVLQNHKVGLI